MKYKISILFIIYCSFNQTGFAQTAEDFPELIITKIPGAPSLSKPQLIKSENGIPLTSQGYGLAAPAFYDWDGDGLKDLLIGEFASGVEAGRYVGNFIRVYKNIGTEEKPAYNSDFDYARPPYELPSNGTPYSVDQFCCLGFTPQFADINNDGFTDMLSGQYFGEVVCFNGSGKGFHKSEALEQRGNPREKVTDYKAHNSYWLFSAVDFGDCTGDGKLDMIIGGRAILLSENTGSLKDPQFGKRKVLTDPKGDTLKVYEYTEKDRASEYELYTAGDYKLSPVVTDWDNDGALDVLITNSYNHKGLATIDFFKGIKINGEYHLQQRVPLFTVKQGKAFPGIAPHIFVCDYNNDGIKDLLIGNSIAMIHDQFSSSLSWSWEHDTGLQGTGKDPGYLKDASSKNAMEWLMKEVKLPNGVSKEDYATMKHVGYVYVMLGSK